MVWDRQSSLVESFCGKHNVCTAAASPKEVVEKCKKSYSMLNLTATSEVFSGPEGWVQGVSDQVVIIDCANIDREHLTKMQEEVTKKNGVLQQAPVNCGWRPT